MAPSSPAAAASVIVADTHKCVASNPIGGYRGVVCVDIALDSAIGRVQGRAQAVCQAIQIEWEERQCAGISLYMYVRNITNGSRTNEEERQCGRRTNPWHNPACPATGRLQFVHSGAASHCGHVYDVNVTGSFDLPVVESLVAASVTSNHFVYTAPTCPLAHDQKRPRAAGTAAQ